MHTRSTYSSGLRNGAAEVAQAKTPPHADAETEVREGGVDVAKLVKLVRSVPGLVKDAMETRPALVVAGVGVTSFALGALLGSKVGRVLTTAAIGYALNRVVVGVLKQGVAHYTRQLLKSVEETG